MYASMFVVDMNDSIINFLCPFLASSPALISIACSVPWEQGWLFCVLHLLLLPSNIGCEIPTCVAFLLLLWQCMELT